MDEQNGSKVKMNQKLMLIGLGAFLLIAIGTTAYINKARYNQGDASYGYRDPTPRPNKATPPPVAPKSVTYTKKPTVIVGPTSVTVKAGQSVTLSVTSYDAETITVEPRTGVVNCVLKPNGSAGCTIKPTNTTTYKFTAKNNLGSFTNQATVQVLK